MRIGVFRSGEKFLKCYIFCHDVHSRMYEVLSIFNYVFIPVRYSHRHKITIIICLWL